MASDESPSDAFLEFATQAISGCIMAPLIVGRAFDSADSTILLGVYLNSIYASIIHDQADTLIVSWFKERMQGHSPVCILNLVFAAGSSFFTTEGLTPPIVQDEPQTETILRQFLQFQIRVRLLKTSPRPLGHACSGPKWDVMREITDDVLFVIERADGGRAPLTREGLSEGK